MRHRGVHVGNFYLVEKAGGEAFTDAAEEVLVLFAAQAAAAIANARTYRRPERMRVEVLGMVSHELRAPLTSIKARACPRRHQPCGRLARLATPLRRGRSRSACVVNGRLRHTGESAVRRAPQCIVSRVGFSVSQTSSETAWHDQDQASLRHPAAYLCNRLENRVWYGNHLTSARFSYWAEPHLEHRLQTESGSDVCRPASA